ncbi:MAG: DUF6966 domain-containing protein [Janthinobacterium lividum]
MTGNSIVPILDRMIELLQDTSNLEWLGSLSNLKLEAISSEEGAARQILRLYGGAGSLNDIILYSGNLVLKPETSEFSELRRRLFEACKAAL